MFVVCFHVYSGQFICISFVRVYVSGKLIYFARGYKTDKRKITREVEFYRRLEVSTEHLEAKEKRKGFSVHKNIKSGG